MFHSKLFSKLLLLNKPAADDQLASLNELILKPFDSSWQFLFQNDWNEKVKHQCPLDVIQDSSAFNQGKLK